MVCSLVALDSLVRESRGHSGAVCCSSFLGEEERHDESSVLGSRWWICVAPRLRGSSTHQQTTTCLAMAVSLLKLKPPPGIRRGDVGRGYRCINMPATFIQVGPLNTEVPWE
jgi:hypothetical protein